MADNHPSLKGRRADGGAAPVPGSGRWVGLAVISVAQLMVALDATIMNVALPSAQRTLAVSEQRPAMLTVSVQEYDIADVRPVFRKEAE